MGRTTVRLDLYPLARATQVFRRRFDEVVLAAGAIGPGETIEAKANARMKDALSDLVAEVYRVVGMFRAAGVDLTPGGAL